MAAMKMRAPWKLDGGKLREVYPGDSLAVKCWCEQSYVLVKRTDILDGRTMPCGKADCHPPRDAA